ncbi:MAG: hypothetical protein GEV07_15860 [Streptosporangiales bacterium]|nr:hypothetical protein [Streptosporangiales bacterium]
MASVAVSVLGIPAPQAAAHAPPAQGSGVSVTSGGGFLNSTSYEAGSYAFAVQQGDDFYLVTARHVAPTGAAVYGSTGLLGQTSSVSTSRDTAYVRLNQDKPDGHLRIGTAADGSSVNAAVDSVATRGSIAVGQRVCHSGYAESTQQAGGYVCGEVVDVPASCSSYLVAAGCQITMRGDDGQQVGWLGDSGGPVWQSVAPGRVRLLGVFTAVSSPAGGSASLGHFVPAFDVLDDLGGVPIRA